MKIQKLNKKLEKITASIRKKRNRSSSLLSQARSLFRSNPLTEAGRRNIINTFANLNSSVQKISTNRENPPQDTASIPGSSDVLDNVLESSDYIAIPSNPYPEYNKCDRNNPLGCDRPLETLKAAPTAKFCGKCGFPAPLPTNIEIRGRRGIYQVKSFLSRQGNGRIYDAVQQNNGRSVIVKEYLIPRRYFPSTEIRLQKKEIFTRVVNFQVAQTIPSDFRLIIPSEGISDRDRDSCYLITNNLAALPNLKTYLVQQGRMEREQVIKLLDQVLQSLEFLHSHQWKFASGEIQQGLIHGNLSLDTLLISQTEVGFLVYLWDLSVWDELFQPTNVPIANKKVVDDLTALGNIGLYLLAAPEATQAHYPLNPRHDPNWRGIAPPLQDFLHRLLGLDSPFENAVSARRELHQLSVHTAPEVVPQTQEPSTTAKKTPNWLFWTIFSAIILLLGGGIWLWRRNLNSEQPVAFSGIRNIADVKDVPPGKLTYGIVASSKLQSIFETSDTYRNVFDSDVGNFTKLIRDEKNLQLKQEIFSDRPKLIRAISPQQIDFALVNLTAGNDRGKIDRDGGRLVLDTAIDNSSESQSINNREQLNNQTIAYDGLLVFVPFVDCGGCQQLGKYLSQKITLEQLRKIYTAEVSNWRRIYPDIPEDIPIRAFAPQDKYTRELFEQLLFGQRKEDILAFRRAIASGKIQERDNYSMLRDLRNLWLQEKIGGIGFDLQSLVYKQCNVYPLSVIENESDFFPMLIQQNQTGVNLFEKLSCKDSKQDYQLNETVFRDRQYPLAFSLNLLYLNDDRDRNLEFGQKITEIFQTEEFQCHLSDKNFIPLELSEKDCEG